MSRAQPRGGARNPGSGAVVAENANWDALDRLVDEDQQDIDQIVASDVTSDPVAPSEGNDPLWNDLRGRNDGFNKFTRFTEQELENIWIDMQEEVASRRRRGPPPKISMKDSLLLLLMLFRFGLDYQELSIMVTRPVSTVRSACERVLPALLETLRKKWFDNRFRPNDYPHDFPHILLAVDTTSSEIYRPVGLFAEAKVYFDGKNKIYALKKEVAVLTVAPHYALFSMKAVVGSRHDYTIFKENFREYIPYLNKTQAERTAIPEDTENASFAILGDKAYEGPETDTPGLRREFVKRMPPTQAAARRNEKLSKIRVHVECFFGRIHLLFKFARIRYKMDHSMFDDHFDAMLLLTNEHLRRNELSADDIAFRNNHIQTRIRQVEERAQKKRNQSQTYAANKRRRMTGP